MVDIAKIQEIFILHFLKNLSRLEVLQGTIVASRDTFPDIHEIYRIYHNLGSGAAMAGYMNLSRLARSSETWLETFANRTECMKQKHYEKLHKINEALRLMALEIQETGHDGAKIASDLIRQLGTQTQKAMDDGFFSPKTTGDDH
jgi:chemotaxis protein histidine kinase CheA